MAWTTPRTWVAGETVTAALLNTHVRDNLKAVGDPWTSWTPTITGVSSSSVVAKAVSAGKLTQCRVKFTLTAAPTATVSVSLPSTATTSWGTGAEQVIGSVVGLRQSAGYHGGHAYQASSTTVSFVSGTGSASSWSAGVPVAWANGDIWTCNFIYEAA